MEHIDDKTQPSSRLAPVLVVPVDVSPHQVKEAQEAGYVVIQTDDAARVTLAYPGSFIRGSDVLYAAMDGLATDGSAQRAFGLSLLRRILAQQKK